MGKPTGFLEHGRHLPLLRPRDERVRDFREVTLHMSEEAARKEASRCMDCGVPFCTWGCPLGNVAPDFNDLVYRGRWREALDRLHSTNNFPELTGLVCPAPCEAACVLGLSDEPVSIRQLEHEIVRHGFEQGFVVAHRPRRKTGRSVAIVGSGPAGLAAAQQLARAGHDVTVFDKADRPGGLLRYGIPDFKLEKGVLDRRLEQLRQEGIRFVMGVNVGVDLTAADLERDFDAILLALGCGVPRDLPVAGRELSGVHFALDFLLQQNRRCAGDAEASRPILARGMRVVVLGGGDTGSDCVGTALRQGASSVTSLELLDRAPDARDASTPWPRWPLVFRTSSSHDEGGQRDFAVLTKGFSGDAGRIERLHAVRVAYGPPDATGRRMMEEVAGSEHTIECDLALLALGFVHPVRDGLLRDLEVELDPRGNVAADPSRFATSVPGVFAAGDVRRGQSLVVWALWEGREAARAIDEYLTAS
jgi:glutamate synthase (NADPH/NADH) small chain